MNKRIIAALLAVVMAIQTPLIVLANGHGGGSPINKGTVGNGTNPSVPYSDGIKVSVGPTKPIIEAGVQALSAASTPEEVIAQDYAISDINNYQMWDPGNFGLNFGETSRTNVSIMWDPIGGNQARKDKKSSLAVSILGVFFYLPQTIKGKRCSYGTLDSFLL